MEASKADYQDHYDMHLHISDLQISLTNMVVNHMEVGDPSEEKAKIRLAS